MSTDIKYRCGKCKEFINTYIDWSTSKSYFKCKCSIWDRLPVSHDKEKGCILNNKKNIDMLKYEDKCCPKKGKSKKNKCSDYFSNRRAV